MGVGPIPPNDAYSAAESNSRYVARGNGEFWPVSTTEADLRAAVTAAATYADTNGQATVFLPPGTYPLTSALSIAKNVSLIGSGRGQSMIQASHTNDNIVLITGVSQSRVAKLTIKGSANTRIAANYGLHVLNSSNVDIVDVEIGVGIGSAAIYLDGGDHQTVDSCYVHGSYADGIHLANAIKYVLVNGNHVVSSGDDAISVASYQTAGATCEHITISSNTAKDSSGRGISVLGGSHISIDGNTIENTSNAGVLIAYDSTYTTYNPLGISVVGNTINNAGQNTAGGTTRYGIYVGSNAQAAVIGNTIRNSAQQGILVFAATSATIVANHIVSSGAQGIHLDSGAADSSVSSNIIVSSAQQGILLNAGVRCTVTGNTVRDPNTSSTAGVDGIYLTGICDLCTVIGNVITDSASKMERPIDMSTTCTNCTVAGNTTSGGTAIVFTQSDLRFQVDRSFIEFREMSGTPAAPGNDLARLYVRDNGGGKTQLVVVFSSGAVQVIATQP